MLGGGGGFEQFAVRIGKCWWLKTRQGVKEARSIGLGQNAYAMLFKGRLSIWSYLISDLPRSQF